MAHFKLNYINLPLMIQNQGKKQDSYEKYEEHKLKLKEFIQTFQDMKLQPNEESPYYALGKRKYMIELVKGFLFSIRLLTKKPELFRSSLRISRSSSVNKTKKIWWLLSPPTLKDMSPFLKRLSKRLCRKEPSKSQKTM